MWILVKRGGGELHTSRDNDLSISLVKSVCRPQLMTITRLYVGNLDKKRGDTCVQDAREKTLSVISLPTDSRAPFTHMWSDVRVICCFQGMIKCCMMLLVAPTSMQLTSTYLYASNKVRNPTLPLDEAPVRMYLSPASPPLQPSLSSPSPPLPLPRANRSLSPSLSSLITRWPSKTFECARPKSKRLTIS